MSACRTCDVRDLMVRSDENEVRRLARALFRTDNPGTETRIKMQIAEAKRQLTRSRQFREEHQAECGVLV